MRRGRLFSAFILIAAMMLSLCGVTASAAGKGDGWKAAYETVIRDGLKNGSGQDDYDTGLYSYSLYDMDRDGVPELFLHFGDDTSSELGRVYRFTGGKAAKIHEFSLYGNYLASYPTGKGVLLCHARMFGFAAELWTLSGNTMRDSGPIYNASLEGGLPQYPDVGDVVPGAVRLTPFPADDLLPLQSYGNWVKSTEASSTGKGSSERRFPGNDTDFFKKVMNDKNSVIPGLVSRKENCYLVYDSVSSRATSFSKARDAMFATSQFFEYAGGGAGSVPQKAVYYTDLDGDGQVEAVCIYSKKIDDFISLELSIVLKEEKGKVYAFGLVNTAVTRIDPNGVLYRYHEDALGMVDEYAFRLFFDSGRCYLVYVPLDHYSGKTGA